MTNEAQLEVEIRYALGDSSVDDWHQRLARAGFTLHDMVNQHDTYFTSLHKDFIATEECLRIRDSGEAIVLTWKPPSTAEMQASPIFWKEEVDLDVTTQSEIARRLLDALDFIEYVQVEKERRVYRRGTVEAGLDLVTQVGLFIELEIKTPDRLQGEQELLAVVSELALPNDCLSTTPYRDLVKAATAGF
jgi:adenylate cyclase class 2